MIRIVTDSSCDLPDNLIEDHQIVVVPLNIRFGNDDYVDREDLPAPDFWDKLRSSDDLPETAAPAVGRFTAAFENLQAAGAAGIVVVCISGKLSATVQSAQLAVESSDVDIPIVIVDSEQVSTPLGLTVLAASRAAASGGGIDEVVAAAKTASEKVKVVAALDTLEYLKRGGRIGAAQAFFGGLLNVKPLISIDGGVVVPAGRVRTRSKALAAVLEWVEEDRSSIDELAVLHGQAGDLDAFMGQLAEIYPPDQTFVALLGSVVGTHAGPGLLGVCYRLR